MKDSIKLVRKYMKYEVTETNYWLLVNGYWGSFTDFTGPPLSEHWILCLWSKPANATSHTQQYWCQSTQKSLVSSVWRVCLTSYNLFRENWYEEQQGYMAIPQYQVITGGGGERRGKKEGKA